MRAADQGRGVRVRRRRLRARRLVLRKKSDQLAFTDMDGDADYWSDHQIIQSEPRDTDTF